MFPRFALLSALLLFSFNFEAAAQSGPPANSSTSLFGSDKAGSPLSDEDLDNALNQKQAMHLTPEMVQRFADQLGIPAGSDRMNRILNSYYSPTEKLNLAVSTELNDDVGTPQKIYRHIRGKSGIAFPAKDQILYPFVVTKEKVQTAFEGYSKMLESEFKKNTTVPNLPRCTEDVSTRTPTGYALNDNKSQVLADILFIRKEEIPLDYKESFGQKVIVRPYYTDMPNADSLSAIGVGVECLPYRMRVTRSFVIKDMGKNALKNYDKDPHGKGEFSAFMKAKLGLPDK